VVKARAVKPTAVFQKLLAVVGRYHYYRLRVAPGTGNDVLQQALYDSVHQTNVGVVQPPGQGQLVFVEVGYERRILQHIIPEKRSCRYLKSARRLDRGQILPELV
jgi:hypothetical protein